MTGIEAVELQNEEQKNDPGCPSFFDFLNQALAPAGL
jgi:hypothetical protein